MPLIDVFNGDADGLCALHQLRLADPADSELVTGPKRDISLLKRVQARAGDRITVLDLTLARAGKFSYTISKAAIGGLVRAASVDLAPRGILVNGVLPSVIDTPMTRAMLSDDAVASVAGQTGFRRLATPEDVAALVVSLASASNTGVTGQSIPVDLGFSHARTL